MDEKHLESVGVADITMSMAVDHMILMMSLQ